MHTLDHSLDLVRQTPAFGDPNAAWRAHNDTAVAHAIEGRWSDALDAFSEALTNAPPFAEAPDVHALLHGNRAQAHFHCGELRLAVESARRALAARLVCGEGDDAPVARMRADLGVYLAACGELDDAEASLNEALASLERQFGDEDARLATVLENQARVQLLAERPERAEPLLLRLHALLDAREMDAASLASLFGAVHQSRTIDVAEESDTLDGMDVFPQSERAIAATPAVHRAEDGSGAAAASASDPSLLDDAFELLDAEEFPPMRSPSPAAIRSAGLIEPGAHATPQEAMKRTHPLGFEIQYGIPQELLLDGDAA